MDLALACIGFLHRCIDHFEHDRGDVKTSAVTFDVRNDGLVRHVQGHVLVDNDFFTLGRHFDVLVHVEYLR